jgi:alpha-ketoglutarate-dependent taurine dioxygenase
MSHSPLSILSWCDFNGLPLDESLLWRTFHQLMDEHGYVLLCNASDEFDHVAFCRHLGGFVPNYSGAVVGDVRPEPGMDDVYHSGNTRPLTPHTEGYDFQVMPPHYIALWCVEPAEGPGGETTLADTARWVEQLDSEQADWLASTPYRWKTTEGVQRLGLDLKTEHPVLEPHDGSTVVRFSCNNLIHDPDDPVDSLQREWQDRFAFEHVAVDYQRNDMLVWDNWRLLHARNAFSDRRRHLRRIQIAETPSPVAAANRG